MTFRLNSMQTRILFLLIFLPFIGISQSNISEYHFTFEDTTHEYFMYRDTISNPNCIWQVGEPQKTVFTASVSQPNAIVTDTINSYPINDTSSFIIKHEVGVGYLSYLYNEITIDGYYMVNSDTLNDFGKIEFSADNGSSWTLISEDTLNYINLYGNADTWPQIENIVFSGNSNNWQYFKITLNGFENIYNFQEYDTVQYKFTFISDGSYDNLDGLTFDNIRITDVESIGGVGEFSNFNSNIYPNPFSNQLTFEVNNKTTSLTIYDINGKTVYTTQFKNQSQIKVNTSYFKNGIYFYELSDKNGVNFQRGKVVKN